MPAPIEANPAAEHLVTDPPVRRVEHNESSLTRVLEQQTAKVPSDLFLAVALGAMAAALAFEFSGRLRASRFVGMWPAPLLVMGVYNKLVKLLGPR